MTAHRVRKLLALSALAGCALLSIYAAQSMAAGLTRKEITSFNGADSDAGAFQRIDRIAVHESTGTLYVLDEHEPIPFQTDGFISKFNANGVAEDFSALGSSSITGDDVTPPTDINFFDGDIAVDNSPAATNGRFYAQAGDTYFAFAASGSYLYRVTVPAIPDQGPCGIAVDNDGDVWVGRGKGYVMVEYDSAGNPTGNSISTVHEACSIAFDGSGTIYVAGNGNTNLAGGVEGKIDRYSPAGVFEETFDPAPNTDLAVDTVTHDIIGARNDNSEVRQYSPTGGFVGSFHQVGARGVAVRGSTERVYVTNEVNQRVHIFGPLVPLPTVTTDVASNVEPATATLNGTIEPGGISITNCYFEYIGDIDFEASGGWSSSAVQTAPCAPASIPDGGVTSVSADIERPNVKVGDTEAFRFRIVAENTNGLSEGFERVVGFGVVDFDGEVLQANGEPATQAGGHPSAATTNFHINSLFTPAGQFSTSEAIRDAGVELPPGIVGNPQALPICSVRAFAEGGASTCPPESQVGVARLSRVGFEPPFGGGNNKPGEPDELYVGVYNLEAPKGTLGLLGFSIINAFPNYISVRVRAGDDYGLTLESVNAALAFDLNGFGFDFWGVPAEPVNDSLRGLCTEDLSGYPVPGCKTDYEGEPAAFLTLPTSCLGTQKTGLTVKTWEGEQDSASFLSHDDTKPVPNPIGTEGCNTLDFSPSLEARPTTNVADSPSGLTVDLRIPQTDIANPGSTAEAHLRDATVTLPEGLVVNPSGANGLGTCSPGDVGWTSEVGETPATFTPDPAHCPEPSRIGTVEATTPLLDHPLPGGVFVATPYDNPLGSLLALYIAIYDPQSGLVIKLPGTVDRDPVTGRVTTTFDENPQLPFSSLKLNVFGGSAAPLRTPETCGIYSTTSSLTPWSAPDSGPPATPSDTYAIEQGAVGGTCPSSSGERLNTPTFDAGTAAPLAGKDSPLVVNLRREDGSQQFSSVTISPPPGLVGKLAGIPYCPESALAAAAAKKGAEEKASPSCPAASEIGNVTAAAGAGPAPYYAPGKAYLTGPYKGAPLSLAIVTPATAGPFDLGTIVVRAALQIDPVTARITAVSDPIPSILEGIPLDVRSVQIRLDRPGFTRNPSSCNPMSFDGQLTSTLGQPALLSSRFQVGECGRLDFEPRMALRLKGSTKRLAHPGLTAVLTTRPGDANLANVSVALPSSELLDQAHIGTVCTRVQFAASNCPPASVYGQATVSTPLLDYELTGPVYLRSSSNELPDLVPDLRGPANQPIKLEAAGRTDSIDGGIRNTFELIPDAPFSRLVLELQGGKKGLLQNATGICRKTHRATVKFGAHNGLRLTAHPVLKAKCAKARMRHKRSHRRRANRRAAR